MAESTPRPIANRAQRIIARLFEQAPSILRPDFDATLDRAGVGIDAEARNSGRACCTESAAALRRRREEALPALLVALQRACLAGVPESPLATRGIGLQLLDDNATDEAGLLAAIAERHQFRASLPLLLLGQRFAVLLEQPPLPAADVPVGPRAFGIALAGIARRFGLCLHARLALFRAFDLVLMERYPLIAEALDATIDRAGVLPGLAFVPLRPRDVPGHHGRGRGPDDRVDATSTPEAAALSAVNRALDELRQVARLPDARAAERREAIAAMARFLLRHGHDSPEWAEGMQVARSVLEAVRRREPASPEVRRWIEEALRSLGYEPEDAERLAVGLVTAGAAAPADADISAAASNRGAREQRCYERLAALPVGTLLGFSGHHGELSYARLRYHYVEPRLLLLADEDDGQEGLYELDTLARRMAEGAVWVTRVTGMAASTVPGASGQDVARRTAPGPGQ